MEPRNISIASIRAMYPALENDFKRMYKAAYSFPKRQLQLYYLMNCFVDGTLPTHLRRRPPIKNKNFFSIIQEAENKMLLEEINLQLKEISNGRSAADSALANMRNNLPL